MITKRFKEKIDSVFSSEISSTSFFEIKSSEPTVPKMQENQPNSAIYDEAIKMNQKMKNEKTLFLNKLVLSPSACEKEA